MLSGSTTGEVKNHKVPDLGPHSVPGTRYLCSFGRRLHFLHGLHLGGSLCRFRKVDRAKSWFEVPGGDERCTTQYLQAGWDVGMLSRVPVIGCSATAYARRAVMLASIGEGRPGVTGALVVGFSHNVELLPL
jgi:hypothetical protein